MDPKNTHPMMMAPAAPAAAMCFPGSNPPRPRLDDHLMPEDSRIEIIDGQRIKCMANEEHAAPQNQFAAVLYVSVAPGYHSLTELTTRHDVENDFSSDVCIKRQGKDPATGERYMEELAFEVANEQTLNNLKKKARKMSARGVRRIFGLLAKKGWLGEWRPALDDFEFLPQDAVLEDPCLRAPLPIKALLDAAAADDVMAQAFIDKNNRVVAALRQREHQAGADEGRKAGLDEGRLVQAREMLLKIADRRGLDFTEEERARILACQELAQLDLWADRAITAASPRDLFSP